MIKQMNGKLNLSEIQIKNFRLKLGKEIRIAREQKGFSQEELAELLNIRTSTISKIEDGRFGISVDYLVRLSICLEHEFKIIEI